MFTHQKSNLKEIQMLRKLVHWHSWCLNQRTYLEDFKARKAIQYWLLHQVLLALFQQELILLRLRKSNIISRRRKEIKETILLDINLIKSAKTIISHSAITTSQTQEVRLWRKKIWNLETIKKNSKLNALLVSTTMHMITLSGTTFKDGLHTAPQMLWLWRHYRRLETKRSWIFLIKSAAWIFLRISNS